VPSALVKRFLGAQAEQPYLGLTLQPVKAAYPGIAVAWVVTQIVPGGPAAQAGLVVGDRILGINGRLFHQPSDLTDWLDCLIPGQTLTLQMSQSEQLVICTLTVGQLSVQEQAA
jgi:S1-C subfamily serine protease